MHIDARELENNSIISGDICIIGAGAAGISIALDWENTPYKVILLEGGGFEYDEKVQDLYSGETTGQRYYPLKSTRLHYFGGTTGHWAGMCSPFDNIDFIKRDWVPNSGWPISREELDPFFARANKKYNLGPYRYDLEYWKEELPNMNSYPFDDKIIYNKMWQYSQTRYNQAHKEDIINARNIHLYTYANVVDIEANDEVNSVKEVEVKNYAGRSHKVRAKHFIMACGTIQNARMLLASNTQAKNGLGNDNDIVGRYFMEHLEIYASELWLEKPFPTNLYTWDFGVTKASGEIAITEEEQTRNKILNGTCSLSPLNINRHMSSRMEVWQDEDPRKSLKKIFKVWDAAQEKAKEDNTGSISRAFALQTRMEQSPNPNSRVTLDQEKDELGVPRTHLHWELTPLEKRSLRTINQIIGKQAGFAGIGRMRLREFLHDETDDNYWPDDTNAGWHHMGTTRMSDNPKNGVVDKNCKVHTLDNLFVAGAACFCTSGAPNPTLTLTALCLRLSDHVKSRLEVSS